ncbi:MAG TPA: acireductone synthase [Actinospica sp.]|jgi:enolase-phosphatase E1|nr:acireductone synthase [Actinospica sp.]
MTLQLTAHTVVLDIEGTTSAAGFILGDLYDHARPRLAGWIDEHADDPDVAQAVARTKADGGLRKTASTAEVVAVLHDWMDHDVKATPLKTIQGQIWARGFERGELTSQFFDDVIPRLCAWHAAGIRLAVFSSGSTTSQRSWFQYAPGGDLTPLISGYFDTVTAGPKKVESSYQSIARALEAQPGRLLFLTDHPEELAAARRAAWQAVAVRRAGEPHQGADFGGAPEIDSFDALEVLAP